MGFLSSLDKFDSVFGLKYGYLLLGVAEKCFHENFKMKTALQEATGSRHPYQGMHTTLN